MGREYWGSQTRLLLLAALFLGVGLLLLVRLYVFQVVEHERYRALAAESHRQRIPVIPKRGALLDRRGNPLAVGVMFEGIHVVGNQIRDRERTARTLAGVLEMPWEEVHAKIDPASTRPVAVKLPVPAAVAARVEELRLSGVLLQRVPYRRYPEGSLAAQTLGFVGRDFDGLSGLELSLEKELAGVPGYIDTERDTSGQEIVLARRLAVPPVEGADVVLTLDRVIQRTAERILEAAIQKNKATGGVILVMEPSTGTLLAAAGRPTYRLTSDEIFDPGEPDLYKPTYATDFYEPGSVMKVVTMAAGIDQRVISPGTLYNDTGLARVGGATIRNWDGAANGTVSMTEVLVRSSNVGTQHVSGLLGQDRFYDYVKRFGFGQPTGIRLPGESSGMVRTHQDPGWERIDLATNSYGQGIAVTPLQMLTAVSAIANRGVLMQPRLVKEVRYKGAVERAEPIAVRRVVSEQTAATVTDMMVAAINQKALFTYRIPGYTLAGKTGTADFPTNAGYNTGKTYASVVAFAPVEQPRFAVLIRIDAPEGLYGGVVAVPVLQELGSELLTYLHIPADSPAASEHRST
jgi:cell division protein FtsI/penicillin-binding protein 2